MGQVRARHAAVIPLRVALLVGIVSLMIGFGALPARTVEAARGDLLYATGGEVTVTILPSTAFFVSELGLYTEARPSARIQLIGTNEEVGKVVILGTFPQGQELIFGIRIPVLARTYFIGPASRNPDQKLHADVTVTGLGTAIVGFEDDAGGGDEDFDDVVFSFAGVVPDGTPPVITATRSPQPNANGWNNTPVTVTFTCTDDRGVKSVTKPVTVTTEGVNQSATGTCTDIFGNTSTTTVSGINIDLTPPEFAVAFGLEGSGVEVRAVEQGGSRLIADGPITPTLCTTQRTGDTCVYRMLDEAGNSTVITLQITRQSGKLSVRVLSVQYQGRAVSTPLSHSMEFTYSPASGPLTNLTQTLTVNEGTTSTKVTAVWQKPASSEPQAGRTQVTTTVGRSTTTVTCGGLFRLAMVTNRTTSGVALSIQDGCHGVGR